MAKKVSFLMVVIAVISLIGPSEVEGCERFLRLVHGVLHTIFEAKDLKRDTTDVVHDNESRRPATQPLAPVNRAVYGPPPHGYPYPPYGWQGYWRAAGYTSNFQGQRAGIEIRRH